MDGPETTTAGDRPVDDNGGISGTTALAKEAAALFQSRRYSECVDLLSQLQWLKEDDPKVSHNIAVAEYLRDGYSNPRKLLDVLNEVEKQSKGVASALEGEVEAVGIQGVNAVAGASSGTTTLYQFAGANSGGITYGDGPDTSIVTFNIAVIFYHLREYEHALSLLKPLYQHAGLTDEVIALHVCLLLLDVALACRDAVLAADVIQYLEKYFGLGNTTSRVDDGTVIQSQSSIRASANSCVAAQDGSSSYSNINAIISENPLGRSLLDETLETLLSSMGSSASDVGGSALNDVSKSSFARAIPGIDLKSKLQLYKVRFLLLTKGLTAAKQEAELAVNIACGRDSSSLLMLKSQLEYTCGNHPKALDFLMGSTDRTEPGMLCLSNNNLGCISHQLGKHHTSILFFSKALRNCSAFRKENPTNILTYSQDKTLVIFYNLGLQYLACGKPLAAARCFHKSTLAFYSRPLFWLRFAECCLLAQEKGFLRQTASPSSTEVIDLPVIGSGKLRSLVVMDVNSRNRHLDSNGVDGQFGPDDQCRLSLPLARQCLLNALHLLKSMEKKSSSLTALFSASETDKSNQAASGATQHTNQNNALDGDTKASTVTSTSILAGANADSNEAKDNGNSNIQYQTFVSSFEGNCKKENHMMKQAALADLAYVELSLENPLKALCIAKALQQLPDCSNMHIFLGRLYAAEALCRLNQPREAAEQLLVYISDDGNVNFPYSDEDRYRWTVKEGGDSEGRKGTPTTETTMKNVFLKPEDARGSLYLNLASLSAMEGRLEQANQYLKEAQSLLPNNPKSILAAIYVDLLQGKTQDALVKLKQASHVRFCSVA